MSQNVGAGKTELVIASIYSVLVKFIKESSLKEINREEEQKQAEKLMQYFKRKFGYQTTKDALHILKTNQARVIEDNEAEENEKMILSVLAVEYLKVIS